MAEDERMALSRKYRNLTGYRRIPAIAFPALAITLTLLHWFHMMRFLGIMMYPLSFLFLLIVFFLPLTFLWIPFSKKAPRDRVPGYDIVLAVLAFCAPWYLIFNQVSVIQAGWEGGAPPIPFAMAVILWFLMLEAARRAAGPIFAFIVFFFSFFPLYACYAPVRILWGPCFSFHQLASMQVIGGNGMMGTVFEVFGELIVGFMVFAATVQNTGAASFFNDIAAALIGNTRGGNAKVAILASGFFGTISGAAVPNVMTTGSFTIPAMKREGFPPHFAAGVEATASAGGNIMPPVMGTVAFIMSEFIGVPYAEICIAAAVPAILYYLVLYLQIDAYAARVGMKRVDITTGVPRLHMTLLNNAHIVVGFFFLVGILFVLRVQAQAPFAAVLAMLLLSTLRKRTRMTPKGFLRYLETIGRQLCDLTPILASVGLIIGGLTFTGVALAFSNQITLLAGGNGPLLLVVCGIVAFILGMGMTVSAVYIFTAIVIAPALINFGYNMMAVHLFVIYYGMLSLITPPVCLAAFAAAAIAETSPMKAGFAACKLGIAKYLLPFVYVWSPALILIGPFWTCVFVISTATIGLGIISAGLEGYMWHLGKISPLTRILFCIGGGLAVTPDVTLTVVGVIICAAVFIVEKVLRIREKTRTPALAS